MLLSCNWITGGSQQAEEEDIQDDSVATEDDLQAVLSGDFWHIFSSFFLFLFMFCYEMG